MNIYAEPGELQSLSPRREVMMTSDMADKYCARTAFILDILDRPDVPADLRERAARILKLAPAEVVTPHNEPEPVP